MVRCIYTYSYYHKVGQSRKNRQLTSLVPININSAPRPAPNRRDLGGKRGPQRVSNASSAAAAASVVNHLQDRRGGLAILPRHSLHRVADQMHNTGLDHRTWEHRLDRLREALQPVNHRDQDVLDTAVLQLIQDRKPELGAFAPFDPQPPHLFLAASGQRQRDVDHLVPHPVAIADVLPQRVQEHHRVARLNGRDCRACTSADTASVTRLTRSGETSTPKISGTCGSISRTVRRRGYRRRILSSKPSSRITPFDSITGSKQPSRPRSVASGIAPSSISTVFVLCPLRLLARPEPRGTARHFP